MKYEYDWIIKVVVWGFAILIAWMMTMATLENFQKIKFEDRKSEEAQVRDVTVNAGTVKLTNGKIASDYKTTWKNPPELQSELDAIKSRLDRIEHKSFEKDKP